MIRAIVLLALVASALSANKLWNEQLRIKFGMVGMGGFDRLPLNSNDAAEEGWVLAGKNARSSGYSELDLWVNEKELTVSILVDESGYTAGVQVAIKKEEVTTHFDAEAQGLSSWSYSVNGVTVDFWTNTIYFAAEDKSTRIASSATGKLLLENYVTVEGNNGELLQIATNITNIDSAWTEQACIPFMGTHFYYKMTTSLSCDTPFFPWFPLYDKKTCQMIGAGFMLLGSTTASYFESPTKSDVKMIVTSGPECLYDLVGLYKRAITLHIYFVDAPWLITC